MESSTDELPELDPQLCEPVYIPLPKPGQLCPLGGLTRSVHNELIQPTPRNLHDPPVKCISQRQPDKERGIRHIIWSSLKSHLLRLGKERHPETDVASFVAT
jgi:hypothetical protein